MRTKRRSPTSAKLRPGALFPPAKREAIILKTANILADWQLSRFQHEATCRHGIRQALCLTGHGWSVADAEAAAIVREAFAKTGALSRPTWAQGQREHTTPRENCSRCNSDLTDIQVLRGARFCGEVCAKAAVAQRDYETQARYDEVGRSALNMIHRATNSPRPCKHCGTQFQPYEPETTHCSNACARASWQAKLPDAVCECCGTSFRPHTAADRYCGRKCFGAARRTLPDRTCDNCQKVFRPDVAGRRYCCHECSQQHRVAMLEPIACICCGTQFAPKLAGALYCSPRCKSNFKSRKRRAGAVPAS